MNTELLLAHFNRISVAPDAVACLRKFILDLAIRGKLVEQRPNDESVSILLKRIRHEKVKAIERGEFRKERPLPPLATDELPFSIPENWRWSQLAEIGFLSPRNAAEDSVQASFVPMASISAEYGVANAQEVRNWKDIKTGFTHFAEGDVALAKITPCFENGKSTVLRNLAGGIGAGTTELHIVRPVFVLSDFVLIFLKSPYFIESGIPKMTGTAGQKRVPTDYFAYSPFPLPPEAEQQRIVAKVDELMKLCDGLEAAQREQETRRDQLSASTYHQLNNGADAESLRGRVQFFIRHLPRLTTRSDQIKQLRQTISSLAVRGLLVSQMPSEQPAYELLRNAQIKRERLIRAKQLRNSIFFQPVDASHDISKPVGWAITRIGALGNASDSSIVDGPFGSAINTAQDYRESGVPVTRMSNIAPFLYRRDNCKFVDPRKFLQLQRHNILPGDVLLGKVGSIGNAAIYPDDMPEGMIATTGVARFRVGEVINNRYLCILLNALRPKLIDIASQAVQPFLSMKTILNILVLLPPLAEQHRIVAKVDELMTLCDQLEASLATAQTETTRLLESVLHHALQSPALD